MRNLQIVVDEPEKVLKFLEDNHVHIYAVVIEEAD